MLSTQVLKEYCNVALKSSNSRRSTFANPDRTELFEVVQVTPPLIRSALDLHQTRRLAFYDALALASAQTAGCTVLYSEDMNAGEVVGGVQIVNPLTDLKGPGSN